MASGVPSSLNSGRGPRLSVRNRHATSSLPKFVALIWSSGEYLVPCRSPVYSGQSPLAVDGGREPCPEIAAVINPSTATRHRTSDRRVIVFLLFPSRRCPRRPAIV